MIVTMEVPNEPEAIEGALEGLVTLNQTLIRSGSIPPSPMHAGVRYRREKRGLEEWRNGAVVMEKGEGDCEDLNGWLCAGLRESGYDPHAQIVLQHTGPSMYHAVVELSTGEIVDCCPALGMGGRETSASRAAVGFAVRLPGRRRKTAPRREGGIADHRAAPEAWTPPPRPEPDPTPEPEAAPQPAPAMPWEEMEEPEPDFAGAQRAYLEELYGYGAYEDEDEP